MAPTSTISQISEPSHTSKYTAPTTSPDPEIQQLIILTHRWVETLNKRKFQDAEMLEYMCPSGFRAETCFINIPPALSFQEHLDQVREEFNLYPDYHIEILDINATLHAKRFGSCDLYLFVEVSGRPEGTKRQLIEVMKWNKDAEGKWKWRELLIMPGGGGNTPVTI